MASATLDQLQQAANATNDVDRAQYLRVAKESLENLPSLDTAEERRHLASAKRDVKAALYALTGGGAPNQVADSIHDAISEVRDLTANGV